MTEVDPLLEGLTEPQTRATTHVDGALLVLAGPGSGKTRVITRRIAYLVQGRGHRARGTSWRSRLPTRRPGEMRDRVAALLTERQARATTVATFHSLCAPIDSAGMPTGSGCRRAIRSTTPRIRNARSSRRLEDLEINTKNFPPASMLGARSATRKTTCSMPRVSRSRPSNFYDRTVAKVYTKYEAILERNAALDFDDLLLKTVKLLQKHADVLVELRERYPVRHDRRVSGHQPRAVHDRQRVGRRSTRTSCAPATPTSRSTAGAGRISKTFSSLKRTTPPPRSCGWSRTTARPRKSSPRPMR